MCGIAGMIGPLAVEATVRDQLIKPMSHRGPDGSGVESPACDVVLGHCRLAIIDTDRRSSQPMRRGRFWVTYNGELWNYREIKRGLRAEGVRFRTTSDTEVLLAAWERWGPGCLRRLDGMFAFGLWDGSRLWLVKDRWGKCPLAVAESGAVGGMAFASEMAPLRRLMGRTPRELGPAALEAWRPAPPRLVVQRRWWTLPQRRSVRRVSVRTAAKEVARCLEAGVKARTVADVPVCTLLSGGMDSFAIAWFAKRYMPNLTAFTAYRDGRSLEYRLAREAAQTLGIKLIGVKVDLRRRGIAGVRAALADAMSHTELKTKAQMEIAVACRVLARRIKQEGFKVVFSGEGSDELWGTYKAVRILRGRPEAWQAARRAQVVGQHRKNFPRCNKVFLSEGVECRLPFLHRPLVEYGLSLPVETVEPGGRLKGILAEALVVAGAPEAFVRSRQRIAFQVGLGLRDEIASRLADPIREYGRLFRRIVLREGGENEHGDVSTAVVARRSGGAAGQHPAGGLRDGQPVRPARPRRQGVPGQRLLDLER